MKRFIVFILVCLILSGCGTTRIEKNGYNRFKTIATYNDGWEIVDKDTGFSYFIFSGGNGIVPLFDEDGNLYRANGWRDYGV